MKYVIVGGVASGATAAARIRRVDEFADILLLEKGNHISYANCGLPYYVSGIIAERKKLLLQTPASFKARFNVEVRTQNEVLRLNLASKTLTVRAPDGQEYEESYDKLLLAMGASPLTLPFEGDGVFSLRNVEDADKIKTHCAQNNVQKAVVVGANFIGLAIAETLHHAGIDVSLVSKENQVISPVDFSIAAHLHKHLHQKGIHLLLGQSVNRFERQKTQLKVFFQNGHTLLTDMVVLSMGVRPETSLAHNAGLKIGETGAVWVDTFLQTSAPNVYAAGDVIEFPHPLTQIPWLNFLAAPANRQARIAADNMTLGNNTPYEGTLGTAVAKVFDLTVATTGLAAKHLRQLKMPYQSCIVHEPSHAAYYPGALPLCLKLTFHPETGALFGAQCVGAQGVDKRIDRLAAVIRQGGTVADLTRLEHAYAPPFSSARDPIAIAGYAGNNIVNKTTSSFSWREVAGLNPENTLLLDVRSPEEFSLGSIEGALNIPVDSLRSRLAELPKNKTIHVYCAVGRRGYLATRILSAHGYLAKNLSGGYATYSVAMGL